MCKKERIDSNDKIICFHNIFAQAQDYWKEALMTEVNGGNFFESFYTYPNNVALLIKAHLCSGIVLFISCARTSFCHNYTPKKKFIISQTNKPYMCVATTQGTCSQPYHFGHSTIKHTVPHTYKTTHTQSFTHTRQHT